MHAMNQGHNWDTKVAYNETEKRRTVAVEGTVECSSGVIRILLEERFRTFFGDVAHGFIILIETQDRVV